MIDHEPVFTIFLFIGLSQGAITLGGLKIIDKGHDSYVQLEGLAQNPYYLQSLQRSSEIESLTKQNKSAYLSHLSSMAEKNFPLQNISYPPLFWSYYKNAARTVNKVSTEQGTLFLKLPDIIQYIKLQCLY